MEVQDDLIKEFVAEVREHLADMEENLLAIEEAGANIDEELVNKVFRAAHSIKGGSGFFGLSKMKDLAHKVETVLDMVRSRKMVPNPEITNILLAAFDKLREMINGVSESEDADIEEHVASLTYLTSSHLPAEEKDSLTRVAVLPTPEDSNPVGIPQIDLERARRRGEFIYLVEYDLIHDIERCNKNVLQVFKDLYASGEILDCALDFAAVGSLEDPVCNQVPLRLTFATILEPDIVGSLFEVEKENIRLLFDANAAHEAPAVAPTPDVAPQSEVSQATALAIEPVPVDAVIVPATPAEEPNGPCASDALEVIRHGPPAERQEHREVETKNRGIASPGENTLRVDVTLLEALMNLAGELVLSRNQLREAVAQNDRRSLLASSQRINLVTSELQDAIMQTRMQPIGNVFGKFPRVVRDLAAALKKEVQLELRGKDVELDKSLIEGLSDPLTHMVRNAVDHGIERPEDRLRAGKRGAGTLRLEARHEAGQVVVEIADDGRGLDPQRLAAGALEKGLLSQEKLQAMSDKDKMALVFLPGLSTADQVTDVSGRGVGMDVVKTNLDRLGGKVEIDSEPGKGTLFRIKLPLTLAIIPSLIVTVRGERFAIPQINVVELLRVRAEQVRKRIEVVGDAEVLILRDQLLPLLRFSDFLGEGGSERDGGVGKASGDIEIVVVTIGTMHYGMVVDSFQNTEEIVVKPLGRHLKGLQEYAGATIMGDGRVALILDVAGLAARAGLTAVSGSARGVELTQDTDRERLQDTHSLLLFYNGPEELCATPLDTVLRVERISSRQIERVGGRRTMQYRGASLPLVTLSDAARVPNVEEGGRDLAVIVSTVHGREVGLLGAMPVDVIEARAVIDQVTHRQNGIAGSTILRGKTVLLTDLHELVDAVYPEWTVRREERSETPEASVTVLLAEDSDFFRAQVKRFLEDGGFNVLDAPDGQVAWELLLKNANRVQAVVTDIEMPRLTGLGLTQRIRSEPRVADLPVIGLTSLAADEDIARGKAVGITDYQIKLDRDRLLEGLNSLLSL